MAVGVFIGQNVFAARQRLEIVPIQQKPPSEPMIAFTRTALPGEVQILRQRIGLIPGMRDVGMGSRRHFWPRERFLRQRRQRRVRREIEHSQCLRVAGKSERIDETDIDLVEGIGGQRIALVKTRGDGRREACDQPLHLLE